MVYIYENKDEEVELFSDSEVIFMYKCLERQESGRIFYNIRSNKNMSRNEYELSSGTI